MARSNSGTPWPVWAFVMIVVAGIGLYAAQPELLCEQFEIGCSTPDIAGIYWMDDNPARQIIVTHLSGNEYRLEERTGSWPWEGRAYLNGDDLSGDANFVNSSTRMRIEGDVRTDGRIRIEYHFVGETRVDHHVWFPAK